MSSSPEVAVTAFARRIAIAGGLAAASRVLFGLGVLAAIAAIVQRWGGSDVQPAWWWALAAAPLLAAGLAGARRARPSAADAALHLDRRLQLDGLLLAAHDGAELDAAWRGELARRMAGWRAALPAIRWDQLVWRPAAAVAIAALAAFWPARLPVEPPRGPDAFGGVVQSLQQRLATALAQGRVPAGALEAITGRLTELAAGAAAADPSAWRELDGLAQRLAREELFAGGAAPKSADPGSGDAGAGLVMQQALGAVEGLLRDAQVPAFARGMLERALREAATGDVRDLGKQAERLRGLAQRLLGDGDLGKQLARLGLGATGERRVQDLAARLRAAAAAVGIGGTRARRAGTATSGQDQRGGEASPWQLGGGPGPGAVEAARPVAADPQPWSPRAGAPADAAPSTGQGGAAWQLQVAPRHRGLVQRFFAAEPAAADKDKR